MNKRNVIISIGVILVFAVGVCLEKYLLLSQGLTDNAHTVLRNIYMIKEKVVKEISQLISTVKITSAILLGIFSKSNTKNRLFVYKK